VTGFATPEDAARGDLRKEYVHVVGVAIRGERAVVAQIMNADRYPSAYETETATCSQTADGWELDSSSNGDMTFIPTSAERCTVVWWGEAPDGVAGARIRLGDQEQTIGIDDGFFFVVFDEVPWRYFDMRANLPPLPPGAYSQFGRITRSRKDRKGSAVGVDVLILRRAPGSRIPLVAS
jgi:hypothetical protein